MSKNEKIQTLAIILIVLVVIGLLAGFSNRLISRNVGQVGELGDGIRQLGLSLNDASGSLEEIHGELTESINGVNDHTGSISEAETEYIETATGIDNRIEEHRDELEDIIGDSGEYEEYVELRERSSIRAREEIEGIRDILQKLIEME